MPNQRLRHAKKSSPALLKNSLVGLLRCKLMLHCNSISVYLHSYGCLECLAKGISSGIVSKTLRNNEYNVENQE